MAKIDNLELIRARHAFEACAKPDFGGKDGGEVVKKLPPMIRENGLLGALAFAIEGKDKTIGYRNAFDAICRHLKDLKKVKSENAIAMQEELIKSDSFQLRDVTAEAMLYLNYLRRFAEKTGGGNA